MWFTGMWCVIYVMGSGGRVLALREDGMAMKVNAMEHVRCASICQRALLVCSFLYARVYTYIFYIYMYFISIHLSMHESLLSIVRLFLICVSLH